VGNTKIKIEELTGGKKIINADSNGEKHKIPIWHNNEKMLKRNISSIIACIGFFSSGIIALIIGILLYI
jgi:hypothetical protein